METNSSRGEDDSRQQLSDLIALLSAPRSMMSLAIIGIMVVSIIGAFASVAGWLSPGRLTPPRFVDGFEAVNGVHSGFRRNHAKGLCVSGYFEGNGQGSRLSKATVFEARRSDVVGRFSLAGGQPYAMDGPAAVRGFGLRFGPRDGQEWRTAMIDLPVFAVKNPEGFYEQLLASKVDPATGKPDPSKIASFLATHPETVRAMTIIKSKPFSSGFADATYGGLNAFRFVNSAGISTPVRWSMLPVDAFAPEDSTAAHDKNYLFEAFIARVQHGPVQWRLSITIGQPGDPTDDATLPWPDAREHVQVGTLTIDKVYDEAHGTCRDINFDPLVLPDGMAPSDDPLLSARSAVYSTSFRRRAGEKKEPSAVELSADGKGE
jgi:catalase